MEDIFNHLAKKIYDLFVVNPYAVAIQQDDGKYITKYIPYDYYFLKGMLEKRGSAGCYQQGFKNELIKWICLDFDCKDKMNPQIKLLYFNIESQLLRYLKELNITYLTEFSGRRGIHVWILFSGVFSKTIGFEIVSKLSKKIELDDSLFGLDVFPATDSAKGNKVGKQVKFPLSCHRDGGQSFLFIGDLDFECIYDSDFYKQQYKILCKYRANDINIICKKLEIPLTNDLLYKTKYKKFRILGSIRCSASDIEQILGEVLVYKKIFERLREGTSIQRDWFVLLGTLGIIDRNGELLRAIFVGSPAYDEKVTVKNILLWKSKYYPATFSYLYRIYSLQMESGIDGSQTGLEYLVDRIDEKYHIKLDIEEFYGHKNELTYLNDIRRTAIKERYYLLCNDENMVVSVWNSLNHLTEYDYIKMNEIVERVQCGELNSFGNKEYYRFIREEGEEKQRELVVLGAYDRIITTHLAMILAYDNYESNNSYSYNVAFLSKKDIFYNWYTSWGNYIDKIKAFLEIPYMDDWGVIVVDVKKFYDSINFLTIYNLVKNGLSERNKRIFEFLIKYNEELMREIKDTRLGVPQGPAYARIVSEMFIDKILKQLSNRVMDKSQYIIYRYVDDIIIFYKPSMSGELLYDTICDLLDSNGLSINMDKSKLYGKIATLSDKDRRRILRKDKFNYMLQNSDLNNLRTAEEKTEVYNNNISDRFQIEDVAFIFSKKTNEFYAYKYFHKHKKNIFASVYGRGSIFMKFYRYIFSNQKYLVEAIESNCFEYIPLNSLNFKNCISSLYYTVQSKKIELGMFDLICNYFLKKIQLDSLDEEERITVQSLLRWGEENV